MQLKRQVDGTDEICCERNGTLEHRNDDERPVRRAVVVGDLLPQFLHTPRDVVAGDQYLTL